MRISAGILEILIGISVISFIAFKICSAFLNSNSAAIFGVLFLLISIGWLVILVSILIIIAGTFTLKKRKWKFSFFGSLLVLALSVFVIIGEFYMQSYYLELNTSAFQPYPYTVYALSFWIRIVVYALLGITAPVLAYLSREEFYKVS